MEKQWDIVVIGGGLSGLALAAELAAPEFQTLSVLVLEKRLAYQRDRTWSYWTSATDEQHRYSALERASWGQWAVSLAGNTCMHTSLKYRYATIDADVLYEEVIRRIACTKHVQLRLGDGVMSVEESNDNAPTTITTQCGDALKARWVFDARPPDRVTPSTLVQQFAGWEVHTEYDAFDKSTVKLMAFEPQAEGLHFWYVLPYSARRALVESTWISPASLQPNFNQELQHYLSTFLQGQPYGLLYQENGILPLDAVKPFATSRVIALGRGGGTLRPSTGYAFLDTLEHAKTLANDLSEILKANSFDKTQLNWQPQAFTRKGTDHWMDAVFLNALSQDWMRAPHYFMQIFERVEADVVVAFLSGKASLSQRLAIMRALPVAPFAATALRRILD